MVALDTPSLRAATPRRSELSPWFFALIALAGGLASGAPQRAAADGWFVDTDGDGATDDVDPFPCHWRRAGATYVPAENQYGTLAHEDNWPARGDLDFNDAVVAFNVVFFHDISGRTTGARLTVIPRAVGAKTRSGLAVRLPFASEVIAGVSATRGGEARNVPYRADAAGVVLTLSDDLRAEFGPGDTFVNTVSRDASDAPMTVVDVDLSTALDVDVWNGEVDFFFFRTADPSHEVHGPRFQGTTRMNTALFGTADDASNGDLRFIDETGMPFVFVLPAATVWPTERTSIYTIFEAFARFASSGGEVGADFYLQGQQGSSLSVAFAELDAVPGAAAQCSMPACDDGVRNGTESDLDCGGGCGPCDVGRACASDADCATGQCDTGTCVSGAPQVLQPGSAAVVRRGEYAARCARWQGDACLDAFLEYGGRWYGIDDHGGGDTSILNLFCFTATGRQGHTRFDTNGTQRANGSSFTPNARIFAYPFCWTWGSGIQGCQPNEVIAAASGWAYAVTDVGSGPWSAAASAAVCNGWSSACDDGLWNGPESDVDCGGGCTPCALGRACASGADCATGQCQAGACAPATTQTLQPGATTLVVRRGEYAARCARWQGNACLDAFLEYGGRWYGIDDHGGGDTSILSLFCFTATGEQSHRRFDTNGTQRANGSSFTPNARIFAYPFCWTWGSGTQGCQPNEIIAAASSYTYAVTDDGSGPWSAAASAAECSAW